MPITRRPIAGSVMAASLALAAFCSPAAAQYPNKPITIIVPFAAGGPTDVVARLVGDHMSRTLGQTILVENVGGAGGTIGMTRAAQAQPDGYTIAVGNMGTQSAAPALYPNLKYDPAKSFAQIGIANFTPQAIVAKNNTPAKNLKEFIDYLKANQYQAELRPCRGRLDLSRVGPCLQLEVRPQTDACALSRHRASANRPCRRPDRLYRRPITECHSADQGREDQGLRGSLLPSGSRACRTFRPLRKPVSTSFSAPGMRWSRRRGRRQKSLRSSRTP